jgi:hypothetical protein
MGTGCISPRGAKLLPSFLQRVRPLVRNGRVTLAATTYSGSLRKLAEKITQAVPGVLQIDNRILSVPTD